MTSLITKKSIHVNLLTQTHGEFRVFCFKNGLSMQEVVEGLVSRLIEGDPRLIKMVERLKVERNDKSIRKLLDTDTDSIYAELEKSDKTH